ncbi:hypothetical protein N7519_002215 [Penicillium mononematosum]|uniref:uncharacterized protein n=1 Tax=Penicillium mononematosum TaxID=268346 RepID=UPI002549412A|nr:uncharacterized protein N7519_002215 [Penicillium mononematosum]KAJ6187307.1 hypothetical protein N7519_002215 [Penicillium mononematosum]
MPFPDPLLDSYNCPALLRNNMHTEHVLKSESQELKFPPYTSNSAGQIIVGRGEVFCRVPSYQQYNVSAYTNSELNPISATVIRQHFISHGVQVATDASQLKQAQEDAAVQWYKSAQEVEENDYDEDEEEDEEDDEHNDEDKHDEDYEDDGDEEDDDDED